MQRMKIKKNNHIPKIENHRSAVDIKLTNYNNNKFINRNSRSFVVILSLSIKDKSYTSSNDLVNIRSLFNM